MSRRDPRVELHLDVRVLGDLFGLDVETAHLQNTLSGRPYLKLRAKPRNPEHTFADGDVVYGHVQAIEGGVRLGVHRLGDQWWEGEQPKTLAPRPYTMLGEAITEEERRRISADGP